MKWAGRPTQTGLAAKKVELTNVKRRRRAGSSEMAAGEMAAAAAAVQPRLERNIKLRIGELRNLPPPGRELRGRESRDSYVIVALDREEIFRTATAEKSLNPFFGEEFVFLVPRDFRQLSFYVMSSDSLPLSKDLKLGKVAVDKETLVKGETAEDSWYPIQPIDLDSEIQGMVHLTFSYREKFDDGNTHFELSVKVVECCGLAGLGPSGFSDPYAQVVVLGPSGQRSEVRKGLVHRKDNDPHMNETFKYPLSEAELRDAIVRISFWHHTTLSEHIFLGQVNVCVSEVDSSKAYHGWFQLLPRPPEAQGTQEKLDLGNMRLSVAFSQEWIFPLEIYKPLQTLLLQTLEILDITDSALYILSEVYKEKSHMARSLMRIFFKLGTLEQLLKRLIEHEVSITTDPNTLFRGNSIATKMVDEFMKMIGLSYLHRTLQCCIDEIFESRKSCEIDPAKLCEGENIDVNMTNLLFFVEKILSAIVSSSLSCPRLMCRIFFIMSQAAVRRFPDQHNVVQYTSVSGFIFLRFFAPAILSPRLFQMRSEIPSPVVTRTLTLISKTVQSMGNIGTFSNKSGSHKESYLAPLNAQLMDESHIRDIKTYLTAIADCTGGKEVGLDDLTYREGFLIKRAQGRRKGTKGPKNFKRRYFILTAKSLTYAKSRSDPPLCEILTSDLLAVERVEDQAFNMKFMFQVVQPGRILYMQAKNSVELKEWLSSLARVCGTRGSKQEVFHSGAFINNQWTCCGGIGEDQNSGCQSVTLAMQVLSGGADIDLERELNKIYHMFLEGQAKLVTLKGEANMTARRGSTSLPLRVSNLCELLIFVKNLELTCTAQPEPQLGSKHAPYVCPIDQALVVR